MNSSSLLRSDDTPANKLSPRDHLYTAELFTRSVTNWPGNIALVCAHQAPDLYGIPSEPTPEVEGQGGEGESERLPYLRWTFRSLNSGVERLRGGLGLLGAPPGTAVVTFMPNCAEFVLTWWAARGMGLVMAPLNPRSLSNKDEVEHQLATIVKGTCGRKPIIMVFERELLLSEPLKSTPGFAKIFVSGQAAAQAPERNELSFERLMSAKTAANGVGQGLQPTDDEILFTSGSTSRPKAIKMEHPTLSLGMKDFADSPGCDRAPGDLWLSFMPNNHGMGRSAVTSPMCSGGGVVYPGFYFNVAQVVDVLLTEACTHAALVPSLIRLLGEAVGPRLKQTARAGGVPAALTVPERCPAHAGRPRDLLRRPGGPVDHVGLRHDRGRRGQHGRMHRLVQAGQRQGDAVGGQAAQPRRVAQGLLARRHGARPTAAAHRDSR